MSLFIRIIALLTCSYFPSLWAEKVQERENINSPSWHKTQWIAIWKIMIWVRGFMEMEIYMFWYWPYVFGFKSNIYRIYSITQENEQSAVRWLTLCYKNPERDLEPWIWLLIYQKGSDLKENYCLNPISIEKPWNSNFKVSFIPINKLKWEKNSRKKWVLHCFAIR